MSKCGPYIYIYIDIFSFLNQFSTQIDPKAQKQRQTCVNLSICLHSSSNQCVHKLNPPCSGGFIVPFEAWRVPFMLLLFWAELAEPFFFFGSSSSSQSASYLPSSKRLCPRSPSSQPCSSLAQSPIDADIVSSASARSAKRRGSRLVFERRVRVVSILCVFSLSLVTPVKSQFCLATLSLRSSPPSLCLHAAENTLLPIFFFVHLRSVLVWDAKICPATVMILFYLCKSWIKYLGFFYVKSWLIHGLFFFLVYKCLKKSKNESIQS